MVPRISLRWRAAQSHALASKGSSLRAQSHTCPWHATVHVSPLGPFCTLVISISSVSHPIWVADAAGRVLQAKVRAANIVKTPTCRTVVQVMPGLEQVASQVAAPGFPWKYRAVSPADRVGGSHPCRSATHVHS